MPAGFGTGGGEAWIGLDEGGIHLVNIGDAAGEAVELHRFEEGDEEFRIGIMHADLIERDIERNAGFEQDELFRDAGFVGVLDERLAALRLRDFAGACEQGFEIAEVGDELGGGFDADAGNAGDIIDGIACERLDIDDFLGRDAEFLDHFVATNALVFHRVIEGDAVADELHQVFVGGDDGGGGTGLGSEAGIGGDDVIGLEILLLDAGHIKGADGIADEFELRTQFLWRLGAVGLVGIIECIAECFGGMIENDGEVGGPLASDRVAQEFPDHVAEARNRADGQLVRFARQRRQRMEGAENIGRAIDEKDVIAGADGAVGHGGLHKRVAFFSL